MAHAPRESAIVRTIQKRLEPHCVVRKRHGSVFSIRGDPDLYGMLPLDHADYPGRHFELEVKRPGEKPTPLQLTRLREWEAAGAVTGWVTSAQEALELLRLARPKTLAQIFAEEDAKKDMAPFPVPYPAKRKEKKQALEECLTTKPS
jgi:hypothetical protein